MCAKPFAKRGGTSPDIDGDIEDLPGNHPQEFSLRLFDLIMQPAQDALAGSRVVILYKIKWNPSFRIIPFLITLQEETPLILEDPGFDQQDIRDRSRNK